MKIMILVETNDNDEDNDYNLESTGLSLKSYEM